MPARRQRVARATLILVVLGATLGSALDAIHSHFGAISYTSPLVAKAAWWVPLLFAGAYGTGIGRPLLAREEPPLPTWKVALGMGLFIGAYWLTVVPWPWPVRCAVLTAIFVAGWAIQKSDRGSRTHGDPWTTRRTDSVASPRGGRSSPGRCLRAIWRTPRCST